MSNTETQMRYTAWVRRSFGIILGALAEDTDIPIDDPKHPALRRLDPKSLRVALKGIEFMKAECIRQYELDQRPKFTRKRTANASPDSLGKKLDITA